MATELLTHAKTGVIQMGWPKLDQAVAFKGNKDDDKSAKKDDKKKNEKHACIRVPCASRQRMTPITCEPSESFRS